MQGLGNDVVAIQCQALQNGFLDKFVRGLDATGDVCPASGFQQQ